MTRVKNHFYFSWVGSKTSELEFIRPWIRLTNHESIFIEPFAGSAAVSYDLFQNGFTNIILNDRDPFLIELWNRIQTDEGLNELVGELEATCNSITNKEDYRLLMRSHSFIANFIGETWFGYHKGIYPLDKPRPNWNDLLHRPVTQMLRSIELRNGDFRAVCEEYRHNSNAFIFLDPPYCNEDNSLYYRDDSLFGLEDMYTYIADLMHSECKVLLIVSNRLLMRLLFKDFIKGQYDKQYQFSKKRTQHLIIANFDI